MTDCGGPAQPEWVAYEPALVPSRAQMANEGITVLEEWFRWAEEWSGLLRIYGGITPKSRVLEIGCGQGRVAFPLRYILSAQGSYAGFDLDRGKIDFLDRTFHVAHPNFKFLWADVHNTFYNPGGHLLPTEYRFPLPARSQDLVFAASVFTHMVPENTAHYFRESERVLACGGRCVFSFFLLDHYDTDRERPHGFAHPRFTFDHRYAGYEDEFAMASLENPEQMTAYRRTLIERMAAAAGLRLALEPLPGYWSGAFDNWIGTQDVVVLTKAVA